MKFTTSEERLKAMLAYDPYAFPVAPFPLPEVTSREVREIQAPTAVLRVCETAREVGWECYTQYSRGRKPHSINGKPLAVRDYIGVRFGNHPISRNRAYAVTARGSDGKWVWDSTMLWGPDVPPYAGCTITELTAFLMMPEVDDHAIREYVYGLREIKSNAIALAHARDMAKRAALRIYDEKITQIAGSSWVAAILSVPAAVRAVLLAAGGRFDEEEIAEIIQSRKAGTKDGFR